MHEDSEVVQMVYKIDHSVIMLHLRNFKSTRQGFIHDFLDERRIDIEPQVVPLLLWYLQCIYPLLHLLKPFLHASSQTARRQGVVWLEVESLLEIRVGKHPCL